VDQLTWQSYPDLVSATPGKISPQSGPIPLGRRAADPFPGTSERSSTGQGLLQDWRKDNCNNFSVSVCVNEQPDSSLLQARVCGPTAERLGGPSVSILQLRGDPDMA
jgi:hypothetical protein